MNSNLRTSNTSNPGSKSTKLTSSQKSQHRGRVSDTKSRNSKTNSKKAQTETDNSGNNNNSNIASVLNSASLSSFSYPQAANPAWEDSTSVSRSPTASQLRQKQRKQFNSASVRDQELELEVYKEHKKQLQQQSQNVKTSIVKSATPTRRSVDSTSNKNNSDLQQPLIDVSDIVQESQKVQQQQQQQDTNSSSGNILSALSPDKLSFLTSPGKRKLSEFTNFEIGHLSGKKITGKGLQLGGTDKKQEHQQEQQNEITQNKQQIAPLNIIQLASPEVRNFEESQTQKSLNLNFQSAQDGVDSASDQDYLSSHSVSDCEVELEEGNTNTNTDSNMGELPRNVRSKSNRRKQSRAKSRSRFEEEQAAKKSGSNTYSTSRTGSPRRRDNTTANNTQQSTTPLNLPLLNKLQIAASLQKSTRNSVASTAFTEAQSVQQEQIKKTAGSTPRNSVNKQQQQEKEKPIQVETAETAGMSPEKMDQVLSSTGLTPPVHAYATSSALSMNNPAVSSNSPADASTTDQDRDEKVEFSNNNFQQQQQQQFVSNAQSSPFQKHIIMSDQQQQINVNMNKNGDQHQNQQTRTRSDSMSSNEQQSESSSSFDTGNSQEHQIQQANDLASNTALRQKKQKRQGSFQLMQRQFDPIKNTFEQHVKKYFRIPKSSDLENFKQWIKSFKDDSAVVQGVVQAYAAVLIARENRYAKMHENWCNVVTEQSKTQTMFNIVQEKCQTEVVKHYLAEKFQTQRENFKETRLLISRQLQHREELAKLKNGAGVLKKNFMVVLVFFGLMTGIPKRRIAAFVMLYYAILNQDSIVEYGKRHKEAKPMVDQLLNMRAKFLEAFKVFLASVAKNSFLRATTGSYLGFGQSQGEVQDVDVPLVEPLSSEKENA